MVTVTILKAGQYNGRLVARGDVIKVAPVDALVLERKGLISLAKPTNQTRSMKATTEKASKRSTYHRRDLRAEP